MFREIIKKLRKLVNNRESFDPLDFNDPIALEIPWAPLKGGGSNFCTHKLIAINQQRMEFRSTLGAKLFYLIFLAVGVIALIGFSAVMFSSKESFTFSKVIIPLFIGSVFTAVGGVMFYFGTMPIVFDKSIGYYWKGKKSPLQIYNKEKVKNLAKLDEVYAMQLISEYCHTKNSSYYSYELNLILKDKRRINIVDHGNKKKIREDARVLAGFLERPIWDAV